MLSSFRFMAGSRVDIGERRVKNDIRKVDFDAGREELGQSDPMA